MGGQLAALRTANGMWPSDRLSLRPVLRIPLSLCSLPPAKRIEIESDNRAVVWEGASPTSGTSQPRSASWGLVAAARANGTALSEASRVSLEMSASGSSGAPSARTSFDLLASSSSDSGDGRGTIRNVPALSPTDAVGAYLATTNTEYGTHPVGEPDDVPDLPTTARPRRASSSASSQPASTARRTLRIQTVPENELGFFSAPDTARPARSHRPPSNEVVSPTVEIFRSLEADDALVAGATSSIPPALGSDDEAFSPYSVAAGTRAARLRQRSAIGSTGRHSPALEPSTPPLSRRGSFRAMSPSAVPARSTTPLRTGSPATIVPHSPFGESFHDQPPGSPGGEKKKHVWPVAPPSRSGSTGQGPKRPGLGVVGLGGHAWSFGSGSGQSEGGGSNSSGGGTGAWLNGKRHSSTTTTTARSRPTSSGGGGKWNTVRPGQPPPLQAGLRFLEDGPTALADMLEAALSRPPTSVATPAPVQTNGHLRKQSELELDQLGGRPSGLSAPSGSRGGRRTSRWLWDDLEQEARDAGFAP